MIEEKLSYSETAQRFEVSSHHQIQNWERIYLTEGAEGLAIERRGRKSTGQPKKLPKSVLHPSCYHCPYKDITHPGDITIADYWGIDNAAPGFNDNKGVSLVLINNEKGAAMFEKIKGDLTWQQTKIEDSLQPPLVKPFEQPDSRAEFWQDFQRYPFEKMAKKYGGWGMANKVKKKLVRIKKKLFKH
jgi:hypothetical protein